MAKKFFYVCGGFLMLTLAYHFGATTATAQAPGNPIVGISAQTGAVWAVTSSGDVYVRAGGPWTFNSNVFGGSPVPGSEPTWGQVKARYR